MPDAKFAKRVEVLEAQLKNSNNLPKRVLELEATLKVTNKTISEVNTALKEISLSNKRTMSALDKRIGTLEKISKALVATVKGGDASATDKAIASLKKELDISNERVRVASMKAAEAHTIANDTKDSERQSAKMAQFQKQSRRLEETIAAASIKSENREKKAIAEQKAEMDKIQREFQKEMKEYKALAEAQQKEVEADFQRHLQSLTMKHEGEISELRSQVNQLWKNAS